MNPELDKTKDELERAMRSLAEHRGEQLARKVRPILYANLDRGRLQAFAQGNLGRVHVYVEQVADGYESLSAFLHQVQSERSERVWAPLLKRMQLWAYNFMLRKGFRSGADTQEIAAECASEAAAMLLNAHFPYDTDFDPWAHIIVQHACRKYIRKGMRKSAVPEEAMTDIDEGVASLADPPVDHGIPPSEREADLLEALSQLTDARRQVLQFIFFDELPPEQVAKRMKKSVGAVYSLQFHGLQDLRKILGRIGNSLNE